MTKIADCPYGQCTMRNLCKRGYCVRKALEDDGWKRTEDGQLDRRMDEKPPQAAIDRLIDRLRNAGTLSVMDRMTALWFIRQSEGWPTVDEAEAKKYDQALDDWFNHDGADSENKMT